MPTLERDEILEQVLLEAVIQEERERPRSAQRTVGPSEVGGCRELLRSKIYESGEDDAPEEHWSLAAHIGTVMGDELERIFGKRLDAVTQQRITTVLEELGVSVTGSSDVIFERDNLLIDLKSTATMASIMWEGPKLGYYIQIALYVWGAVQAGILQAGAEGRIVYYERSGNYQGFVAVVVSWEAICNFVEIAQQRLTDVVEAQDALEAGDPTLKHELRDYSPSYCFSTKVECPRRYACWGGSEWAPVEIITDPNHLSAARRYVEGRTSKQSGEAMMAEARSELVGVEGRFEEGFMVGWTNNKISVVETGPIERKAT
jgi:hypothetical protein